MRLASAALLKLMCIGLTTAVVGCSGERTNFGPPTVASGVADAGEADGTSDFPDNAQSDGGSASVVPSTSPSVASPGTTGTPTSSTCGDGVVHVGEECDDGAGNSALPGACRLDCTRAKCGDGVVDPDEQCDLGGVNSDTEANGCSLTCLTGCGNAVLDTGEPCDNGADNSDQAPDACRTSCELAGCGDGVIDPSLMEQCDEGGANDDATASACRSTCRKAFCGDGIVDLNEGCDDGLGNAASGAACTTSCRLGTCGNGVLDAGEECDEGTSNSDTAPSECRTFCRKPACGDGALDPGEACDDGLDNSATRPDACRTDCSAAGCGDGIVDPDEECDGGEGCDAACTLAGCGNARLDSGEECDPPMAGSCDAECHSITCGDGLVSEGEDCEPSGQAGDDCTALCRLSICGDGIVEGSEACEPGADVDCSETCTLAVCGDAKVEGAEACDNGTNDGASSGCSAECTEVAAGCGDGMQDEAEECDEGTDANTGEYAGCTAACKLGPRCGDGSVQADEGEECDDGEENNTGGYDKCSSTCTQGPRCGDGTLQADEGEQCDGEDNCENSCQLTPCPNSGVRCDDVCINPTNNNEYCGASGNCQDDNAGEECGADDICQAGECVFGGELPKINSFVVADAALPGDGGSTTLSWSVSDATSLSISSGVGTVTGTSKSVDVSETTTFTLTATNPGGSVEAEVTVEVKTLGVVQWQAQLGSDQIDNGVGVGIDGSGNVIMGGSAGGDIDGAVGGTDGFLVKYSASGSEAWRTQFGTDTEDSVEGIAVSSNGTTYAYGITYGTFADNTRQGRWDAYVAKFNTNGTLAWVRQFGTASDEYVYGGALASDGGVLIVGHTYGAFDGAIAGVGADAFVAKYSASGELVWKDQFGVDNDDSAKAVACDATGSVFVTGTTEGVLETGKNNLGLSDAFLTRYSSAGVRDWTRQFGTAEYEEPYGIVADANGNPAVVGYTAGALDGPQLGGAGDVFIVSYSSTGTLTWKDQFGTNKWDGATAVVPDPDGSLYIIGETTGDLDGFAQGGRDGFITKYSSSGVQQWLSTFGGAGQDDTRDAAYAGGIIAVAGWTDGEMGGTQQGVVDAYVTTIE